MPLFGRKKSGDDPAEDLKIARKALSKNDLPHALHHIGLVLGVEPNNADGHALLNQVLTQTNNPLSLIPQQADMHFSTVALRAELMARHWRWGEAIDLMTQVHDALPDMRYLGWVARWVNQPDALTKMPSDAWVRFLAGTMRKFGADGITDATERQLWDTILPKLTALSEKYPEGGIFTGMLGVLLRNLGRFDESIAMGKRAHHLNNSYHTAVMLATTYRVQKDYENALAMFQEAVPLNNIPNDVGVLLDMGDIYEEMGQPVQAIEQYEKALSLQPNHHWATPHVLYNRYVASQNEADLIKLLDYVEANPENPQGLYLLHQVRDRKPYFDYLPPTGEAIINAIQQAYPQLTAKHEKTGSMKIGVSSLEPPSAQLAILKFFAEWFDEFSFPLTVAEIQKPDPRIPRRPVKYVLWKYASTGMKNVLSDPTPTLPTPNEPITELISDMARYPYRFETWGQFAQILGPDVGPSEIPDLLAVMVHPPARPENREWWDWLQLVQIAAAFVIAYTESSWQGSERREALVSLLYGPMDWTIHAAALALTHLALEDATIRTEAISIFNELLKHPPTPGHVVYAKPLQLCLDRLHEVK